MSQPTTDPDHENREAEPESDTDPADTLAARRAEALTRLTRAHQTNRITHRRAQP